VLCVLALAFYFGSNTPGAKGWNPFKDNTSKQEEPKDEKDDSQEQNQPKDEAGKTDEDQKKTDEGGKESPSDSPEKKDESPAKQEEKKQEIDPVTGKDKYQTDPVPEGKPIPVEPDESKVDTEKKLTCYFYISCATILDNLDLLNPEKEECVPEDGVILQRIAVSFYEGENVADVLVRVCQDNKIHMEASWTPIYNSSYIEGINNLYEFDCGEMSGWMYSVNGWFPNYGASRYVLADGDEVQWHYTCNLGYDVGGGYMAGE